MLQQSIRGPVILQEVLRIHRPPCTSMSLTSIFLEAFFWLVKYTPNHLLAYVAAISTLLSAVVAFLRFADQRQLQLQVSREFVVLRMKMVRCGTHNEF